MADQKALLGYLKNAGHSDLMPMQERFIEASRSHAHLALYAQTGSGKTLAFLFAALDFSPVSKGSPTIIVAPSRELCLQIETVFRSLGTGRHAVICYGGHSVRIENDRLSQKPDFIIGTPGRLCDHLRNERIIQPESAQMLIIDEFDKCLEAGFSEEMSQLFRYFTGLKKKVLVSATSLLEVPAFCAMPKPFVLDERNEEEKPEIEEISLVYDDSAKDAVFRHLCQLNNEKALVFCNYREVAEDVSGVLNSNGLETECYHGGLEQDERERALIKFRNGSVNILVCTDLGSRGLDIPEVRHVIHFQLPSSQEAYIHRNGRTARMGASGFSYLLKGPDSQLPFYVQAPAKSVSAKRGGKIPKPENSTLYIGAGKKDKVNKVDVVGFLIQQGGLEKQEIGLIQVQDHCVYVAVPSKKSNDLLHEIRGMKIKGKKVKIAISR